jgi:dTMP kinase
MKKGRFFTFEGIDGAGKSSHVSFVKQCLEESGATVVSSREPGGTAVGEKLRDMLLHEKMDLETEALLMFASRREHIAQLIEPALARGDWVLSDRFTDSSFAFQCGGRGIPVEKMSVLEQWVHPGLQPDITFLFDVPTEVAAQRMQKSRETMDRFELEQLDFHVRVRNEYLRRAAEFPDRFRVIDATRSIPEVQEALRTLCLEAIAAWNNEKPLPRP